MQAFDLADLKQRHKEGGRLYHEFLRVPALSTGLYILPAGGADPQQPHDEDEVYFVIGGRATINVDGEDRPVQTGTTVYVAARVPHHFHSIEEDLTILVFFAPAETA
ncbi:MAG: cupin domain-containing protein [Thermomicrobiales bacterium]